MYPLGPEPHNRSSRPPDPPLLFITATVAVAVLVIIVVIMVTDDPPLDATPHPHGNPLPPAPRLAVVPEDGRVLAAHHVPQGVVLALVAVVRGPDAEAAGVPAFFVYECFLPFP